MRKIAVYGKGGIGKSTTTSNISAALSVMGYKVMQVGCDPKADSTLNLLEGQFLMPVLEYMRKYGKCTSLEQVVLKGFNDIICVEAGGPSPGLGCAGRGIITTFEVLDQLGAYSIYQPDVVFYDVLGDVVCGGFAMPIRNGYADEVLVVTSGEKMALYAAENIIKAVRSFSNREYACLKGIILNCRNIEHEEKIVRQFAFDMKVPIVGVIPRDNNIHRFEAEGKTVVQGDTHLPISQIYFELAKSIISSPGRGEVRCS